MIGVCVVITAVIEFTLSASAHHHETFSPLFIGPMIEIVSRIDIVADGEYDTVRISLFDFCATKQYSNRRLQGCQDFFVSCLRLQWHPNFDIMPSGADYNFTTLRDRLRNSQVNILRRTGMKKAVILGERQAGLAEVPDPQPKEDWVVVKVHGGTHVY